MTPTPSAPATIVGSPTPSETPEPTSTHAVAPSLTPQPTATPTAGAVTHIVIAGETLSGIAQEYNVTVQAIVEANELANPDLLEAGQVLIIPVQVQTATPT
jgi:LysM repeat protein